MARPHSCHRECLWLAYEFLWLARCSLYVGGCWRLLTVAYPITSSLLSILILRFSWLPLRDVLKLHSYATLLVVMYKSMLKIQEKILGNVSWNAKQIVSLVNFITHVCAQTQKYHNDHNHAIWKLCLPFKIADAFVTSLISTDLYVAVYYLCHELNTALQVHVL